MVRRIRLAALQRANGQRGAIAGQRVVPSGQRIATTGQRIATPGQRIGTTGQRIPTARQRVPTAGQRISSVRSGFNRDVIMPSTGFNRNAMRPQTLNRAPVQTGIRRVGTQTRMVPDIATRRRIAAMNAARNRGTSAPRQTMPLPRSTIQTEMIRPSARSPARVDEAVLRANIVPAGVSPGSSDIRRGGSISTSGSSSRDTVASPTMSSDSRMMTSGSTSSGGGGVIQTGRAGAQPIRTVIAPAPDIQFRTTVGDIPATSVSAGVSGIGAAAPLLASGPAFQVISGDASNVIIGSGANIAESMPVDVGGASDPALVVNPTAVSSATGGMAPTPVDSRSMFQGGPTLPNVDPTIKAETGSAVARMDPVGGGTRINGAPDIQLGGLLSTMGSMDTSGASAIVPGATNVPTTIGMCFVFNNPI